MISGTGLDAVCMFFFLSFIFFSFSGRPHTNEKFIIGLGICEIHVGFSLLTDFGFYENLFAEFKEKLIGNHKRPIIIEWIVSYSAQHAYKINQTGHHWILIELIDGLRLIFHLPGVDISFTFGWGSRLLLPSRNCSNPNIFYLKMKYKTGFAPFATTFDSQIG